MFFILKGVDILARLVSCSACCRVHAKDYVCEGKSRQRRVYNRNRLYKTDRAVYGTNKWRTVRGQVLEDCNHICLYTFYTEGKIVKADDVHHIIEILEDESLAFEEDNLIGLSEEKHKLVHELYKENKEKTQDKLREFKVKWREGERMW